MRGIEGVSPGVNYRERLGFLRGGDAGDASFSFFYIKREKSVTRICISDVAEKGVTTVSRVTTLRVLCTFAYFARGVGILPADSLSTCASRRKHASPLRIIHTGRPSLSRKGPGPRVSRMRDNTRLRLVVASVSSFFATVTSSSAAVNSASSIGVGTFVGVGAGSLGRSPARAWVMYLSALDRSPLMRDWSARP